MPVSKDNVDAVITLLQAIDQRGDAIRQVATNLSSRSTWRLPDGRLGVELTPSQQETLEGFVREYAKDCRQALAAIEALIGPAPE